LAAKLLFSSAMMLARRAAKLTPVVSSGEGPERTADRPGKRSRRSKSGIPKPPRQLSKGLIKVCFLLVICGLTWMIWQSNQNVRGSRPNTPRPASLAADVPSSVGRFISGLLSSNGGARAKVRPEDHLQLQGIILSRRHPIAMINMTAFEQGSSAPLRLAKRDYSVHCLDILQEQVTVRADDRDPVTLELNGRKVR
jgi:hypothetical protein